MLVEEGLVCQVEAENRSFLTEVVRSAMTKLLINLDIGYHRPALLFLF